MHHYPPKLIRVEIIYWPVGVFRFGARLKRLANGENLHPGNTPPVCRQFDREGQAR